jgi:site-specific DNA recombinase
MAPDLLFYPVLDETEALAGMSNREVVHPTAQDRVNQLHDPIHWLRLVSAEHFLELPQQRSSFLELGRVVGTPYAPTTTNTAEIETQKAEAFAAAEVYISTLLFIDLDLQFGELFAESFLHRHHQPVMSGVGVDQDHQIIGKPCVLDVGVLAVARGLFRPLQHPIHLGEVEVTEERRDHPALRDAALTVGLEHQLQQMQHVRIIHPSCHLRVSTGRQADNDLSIPDQRRQAKGYGTSRGWQIVADYVEPGVTATDDRRPEFQRMIDAASTKPPAFDMILVHSFSRFFRDQFQLEFYVRRLAKNGVRLVSITQELGDDPTSNMIRQIMALFDEYQSKENAKHTLRAMKENARQGFWNGSLPPIGYRIVEAAEQHGHRTKKTLEVDPVQAVTVRLIFRLAREGDGASGPMGVKSITKHLNTAGIRTRDGGRWGIGAVHKVLTRTTYVGRHRFNTKFWKTRERKPDNEVVEMAAPSIVEAAEFEAVQALLKSRSPALTAPRVVSGPTLLTGICFCSACGKAMTLRTGKGGRYRYYTCSTKARQGETGCLGRTVPMEKLDTLVADHIERRLLQPARLEEILSSILDRREERAERRTAHIAALRKRAAETDAKLKRLYDAIENGVADLADPMLKDRIAELKAMRDQGRADAERAEGALDRLGPSGHTAGPQDVRQDGPQAHADRVGRLPPRPPPRTCPACRSGRERSSHHGVQKRTSAHARRRLKRKNGGFWRAQFYTEVARPKRFELLTPRFVVSGNQISRRGVQWP